MIYTGRFESACLFIFCFFIFQGCNETKRPVPLNSHPEQDINKTKEALVERNRLMIQEELTLINSFVERNSMKMDTTSTGLRYLITEHTTGRQARLMDRVSVSYRLGLLDGSQCYSSDSTGALIFIIGQSDEPSGLQEALLKMRVGEKATIIVPSYLAFGTTGDGYCVPGSSSVIYNIKLDKIIEP